MKDEDEVKANKAEKMKEAVKGGQETSEKQALIVDDSGKILDEGGKEVSKQIKEAAKTLEENRRHQGDNQRASDEYAGQRRRGQGCSENDQRDIRCLQSERLSQRRYRLWTQALRKYGSSAARIRRTAVSQDLDNHEVDDVAPFPHYTPANGGGAGNSSRSTMRTTTRGGPHRKRTRCESEASYKNTARSIRAVL